MRASVVYTRSVGLTVGVLAGGGVAVSVATQVEAGLRRDALLAGLGCAWVLSGAVGLLMLRDLGRQVVLGAMEALVLFFPVLAGIAWLNRWYRIDPLMKPWVHLVIAAVAAVNAIGLRHPGVLAGMRGVGGRRTRR